MPAEPAQSGTVGAHYSTIHDPMIDLNWSC